MNEEAQFAEEETVDPILEAFRTAVDEGLDDENTKLAMLQAGATFKNVTRLYNQYLIDEGLAMSKDEKDTLVESVMADADVSTQEGFTAAVDALVEQGTGVTEKSAASLVRRYAKDNELEVYKAQKSSGGQGRVGFAAHFYNALIENPAMSEEDATTFINEHELSSDNVRKHMSHYQAIRSLANSIAAK